VEFPGQWCRSLHLQAPPPHGGFTICQNCLISPLRVIVVEDLPSSCSFLNRYFTVFACVLMSRPLRDVLQCATVPKRSVQQWTRRGECSSRRIQSRCHQLGDVHDPSIHCRWRGIWDHIRADSIILYRDIFVGVVTVHEQPVRVLHRLVAGVHCMHVAPFESNWMRAGWHG
jgi:hypothetical protein